METHANAIQTLLHKNYLKVFGGKTTRYLAEGASYPFVNIILILFLCLTAYFLLIKINLHPITAGIIILFEGVLYYAFAMGMFTNDFLWFWKSTVSGLIPNTLYQTFYNQLNINLPGPGESYVMPIIAPLVGLALTYSCLLYTSPSPRD